MGEFDDARRSLSWDLVSASLTFGRDTRDVTEDVARWLGYATGDDYLDALYSDPEGVAYRLNVKAVEILDYLDAMRLTPEVAARLDARAAELLD